MKDDMVYVPYTIPYLSDDAGIQHTAGRVQGVHSGVDAKLSNLEMVHGMCMCFSMVYVAICVWCVVYALSVYVSYPSIPYPTCLLSTVVASKWAKVVAGAGSVRSSAGTYTACTEVMDPTPVEVMRSEVWGKVDYGL